MEALVIALIATLSVNRQPEVSELSPADFQIFDLKELRLQDQE
jgi:hypothetical protein